MKKSIFNLGKPLTAKEQKNINGGQVPAYGCNGNYGGNVCASQQFMHELDVDMCNACVNEYNWDVEICWCCYCEPDA